MFGRSLRGSHLLLVLSALLGVSLGVPNAGCGSSESTDPVSVLVTEYVTLSDSQGPLPGAEVCRADTEDCVMTDEEGRASIELPSDSEVSYTITKEGFGSYLISDVNNGRLDHRFIMYGDEELERLAPLMGTTYPWTDTGIIVLRVYSEPGVVFELVGQPNEPFYFSNGDTPSTELDSTTDDGRGGFTDLAEGEYQVEFIDPQVLCRPFTAWPGEMDNRVRVPVKAGYISYSSMSCGEAPTP